MKKSLLLTVLFVISFCMLSAQNLISSPFSTKVQKAVLLQNAESQLQSMQFGYCGDLNNAVGSNPGTKMKIAIQVPVEKSKNLAGNKLKSVLIAPGLESGNKLEFFLTYGLDEAPFYTQKIKLHTGKWNLINLSEPYEIEKKEFFIGYSFTVGYDENTCYPVGLDEGPGTPYGDWIAVENENSEYQWTHLSKAGHDRNVCIKGVIEGESLPQYDLSLNSINIQDNVKPNAPFEIKGKVKNLAASTVTSYDVTYQIGDKTPVTKSVKANIPNYQSSSFTISNAAISTEGSYPVKVTISNLNGHTDEDESNNSFSKTILCTSEIIDRKVLLEHFTTAECPNCPSGHKTLEKVLSDTKRVIWVAHHAGFKTDMYTNDAHKSYMWFFNDGPYTYAPAIMFDRTLLSEYGASGTNGPAPGPVFSLNENVVEKTMNIRLNEPAFVSVNIHGTYNKGTRELSVTISGNEIKNIQQGKNICLTVFLTEDKLISNQKGADSKYEHNHVMQAVLSDVWGDPVSFNGDQYEKSYTTTLEPEWTAENMKIIAFLSNYDESSPNNCEVENAEEASITSLETSIGEVESSNVQVYNVDNTVFIKGEYESATLYRIDGTIVKQIKDINRFSLDKGMYLIEINTKSTIMTSKIFI